ncbi:Tetratricopeptide repeat protein 31 [Liparis tanakae]|uniref:Tetratricopeptide repeat protein 31 n=1 Tax=Liparis tanakae TaxID=230148 RepID=A0A4Z2J5R1_9TELE|nr:Tetratricopeptide repeat protein 31 [Liparis tanakae]
MEIFRDETEFTDVRMVQRVVDLFDGRPGFQRIVRLGLIGMEYDDEQDDTDEDVTNTWERINSNLHGYPRLSDKRSGGEGLSGSAFQLPRHYYTSSELPGPPSVKIQPKESKRKEKKRLEKEKQNPITNEEGKDDSQQCKTEGSKPDNEGAKNNTMSRDKPCASAKDTDSSESSEDDSSDEDGNTRNDWGGSEELDMTSSFVSKAALIAKRKLEQKPVSERRERKKTLVKEDRKPVADKPNEDPDVEKKDSAAISSPTFEDNVKISTDLAVIGNRFASAGDFNMAVKYFTDAIKYNPTEFKLFGNRSFCFEKMQEYEKALTDAELCLSMWPGWVKGLFRKGRALAGLQRYEEAAQAFREVLKLDSSCAEAAQELMWVQITQLMEYGFTREQSSNALIIHGTVKKALEVLSKLNHRPGALLSNGAVQPAQVANFSGVSPVLSANTVHAAQSHEAPKPAFRSQPLGPVQNMSNVQRQQAASPGQATKTGNAASQQPQELFPVWVGNLVHPVTESVIANVFRKVGAVDSVKLLTYKRCAFVNYTKQEYCDEAIRRLHGFDLNGMKIAVRYPDRIPHGLGISRTAHKADDLEDENISYRQNEYAEGRDAAGSRRPFRPYRQVPEYRGNKY